MQTRNIAAYAAWIIALGAVLMPPAIAEAGLAIVSDAPQMLYALVEDPTAADAPQTPGLSRKISG